MSSIDSLKTLKDWKQYIQGLLRSNDKAVLRAVVRVYEMQTDREKRSKASLEDDGKGFNRVDAKKMSVIAEKVKAGRSLTAYELEDSRKTMQKYWKQLAKVAKENVERKKRAVQQRLLYEEYDESPEDMRDSGEFEWDRRS